jgi:mRNA interferase MazF
VAITFHPKAGTVLICDFNTGFREPEMVKARPVIVVSPNHAHYSELYTVVPMSTTPPRIVRPYHYKFASNPVPYETDEVWAKCDMVVTVARHRLDRIKVKRGKYEIGHLSAEELEAIRHCLRYVIGIPAP